MTAIAQSIESLSLSISEETHVRAPIAATFAALLEEIGPAMEGEAGTPMSMTLEAWPGGRWFRDLGEGKGHLWGHVQSIKRPTLLTFRHTALGLFPDGYRDAMAEGWRQIIERIQRRAEKA